MSDLARAGIESALVLGPLMVAQWVDVAGLSDPLLICLMDEDRFNRRIECRAFIAAPVGEGG
jgi:hypothetical protein